MIKYMGEKLAYIYISTLATIYWSLGAPISSYCFKIDYLGDFCDFLSKKPLFSFFGENHQKCKNLKKHFLKVVLYSKCHKKWVPIKI